MLDKCPSLPGQRICIIVRSTCTCIHFLLVCHTNTDIYTPCCVIQTQIYTHHVVEGSAHLVAGSQFLFKGGNHRLLLLGEFREVVPAYICVRVCMYICMYMSICIYIYKQNGVSVALFIFWVSDSKMSCIHTRKLAWKHTCLICITNILECIHAHIHTCTHTYIHTQYLSFLSCWTSDCSLTTSALLALAEGARGRPPPSIPIVSGPSSHREARGHGSFMYCACIYACMLYI